MCKFPPRTFLLVYIYIPSACGLLISEMQFALLNLNLEKYF